MTQGRKPTPRTTAPAPFDDDQAQADLDATARDAGRLAKIDEKYGAGLPYDRRRVVLEARSFVQLTGETLFELGKRLLLLKEHEPHGDFLEAIGEIGVEHTFATRAMKAALKFSPANASASQPLARLGQSKLIELLVLDDEQVEALQDGGTVAGLNLDKLDRMSTRELREALRKERAERVRDRDVHDRVLKQKNQKIDELDEKLAYRDRAPEAERQQALAGEIWRAVLGLGEPLLQLERVFQAIAEHGNGRRLPESLTVAERHALTFLMQQLIEFQERWGIEVDLAEQVVPAWMQQKDAA